MSEPTDTSPAQGIAIVGMAGRFPGAGSLEEFWRNLRDGVESISRFTDEELARRGSIPPCSPIPRYVRGQGVLDGVELFDAAFFGFTPREAELMDPQHRLFLECAWEALEDAGYDPDRFPGRVGVYAGAGTSTYLLSNLLPNAEELRRGRHAPGAAPQRPRLPRHPRSPTSSNLRGPSVRCRPPARPRWSPSTWPARACSPASATWRSPAACRSARRSRSGYLYQEGSIISPDGHCRAFDAAGRRHGRRGTAPASWCSSAWPTRWPTATPSTP